MNTEKSALIKENYELIERATTKLWCAARIDESEVEEVRIEKALTILEIVEENNDVIALPENHIFLIRVMLGRCVLELPIFHHNPLSISEDEKSLLKELILKF